MNNISQQLSLGIRLRSERKKRTRKKNNTKAIFKFGTTKFDQVLSIIQRIIASLASLKICEWSCNATVSLFCANTKIKSCQTILCLSFPKHRFSALPHITHLRKACRLPTNEKYPRGLWPCQELLTVKGYYISVIYTVKILLRTRVWQDVKSCSTLSRDWTDLKYKNMLQFLTLITIIIF